MICGIMQSMLFVKSPVCALQSEDRHTCYSMETYGRFRPQLCKHSLKQRGVPKQCIIRADKPITMFLFFAGRSVWKWGSFWVPCIVTILEWLMWWQLRMRTFFSWYKWMWFEKAFPCVTNGSSLRLRSRGVSRSLPHYFFLRHPGRGWAYLSPHPTSCFWLHVAVFWSKAKGDPTFKHKLYPCPLWCCNNAEVLEGLSQVTHTPVSFVFPLPDDLIHFTFITSWIYFETVISVVCLLSDRKFFTLVFSKLLYMFENCCKK